MIKLESANRPATKEHENAYLLSAYRHTLEKISRVLGLPGSPNLLTLDKDVERMMNERST